MITRLPLPLAVTESGRRCGSMGRRRMQPHSARAKCAFFLRQAYRDNLGMRRGASCREWSATARASLPAKAISHHRRSYARLIDRSCGWVLWCGGFGLRRGGWYSNIVFHTYVFDAHVEQLCVCCSYRKVMERRDALSDLVGSMNPVFFESLLGRTVGVAVGVISLHCATRLIEHAAS